MTPYEAYREYVAIKSHFSTKTYDYFRFSGKVKNVTPSAYESRRDKLFFMKLAKHKDATNFLVANLVESDKWVGDLAYNEEAQKTYQNWIKRTQSLTYNFSNDLSKLKEKFDDNLLVEENSHPYLLQLYLQKEISLETIAMLVDISGCFKYWNKNLNGDPVWKIVGIRIIKYIPFLKYDKEKVKKIVLDKFT